MLSSGFTCMYVLIDGKKEYYCIDKKDYKPLNFHEKEIYFNIVKSKNGNPGKLQYNPIQYKNNSENIWEN